MVAELFEGEPGRRAAIAANTPTIASSRNICLYSGRFALLAGKPAEGFGKYKGARCDRLG